MRFWECDGKVYRELLRDETWVWIIQCENPKTPIKVYASSLEKEVQIPGCFFVNLSEKSSAKRKVESRKLILQPVLENEQCITSKSVRRKMIQEIADAHNLSAKTVQRWYLAYLAKGESGLGCIAKAATSEKPKDKSSAEKRLVQGINKYFYSWRKLSLQSAYELFLQEHCVDGDTGQLAEDHPSFGHFRYLYQKYRNVTTSVISRDGLSEWQRNCRPLLGKSEDSVKYAGVFQMDSTQLDIVLVSRYTRKPIHRPTLYIAVDTCTSLIAGIYVTFQPNQESVLTCLANTAVNKVDFCAKYGVDIEEHQWCNSGLPYCIVTDRGRDFVGERVKQVCSSVGIECVSLPPYRPDLKGKVERAIGVIQDRFKPHLVDAGAIVENSRIDHRKTACLDYRQFMEVLVNCVVYYNAHRVIDIPDFLLPSAAEIKPTAAGIWGHLESIDCVKTLKVNEEDVQLLCLPRDTAQLTRFGVCYRNIFYSSEDVDLSERYVKAGVNGSEKVMIAYEPNTVGKIYMIEGGNYIELLPVKRFSDFSDTSFFELQLWFSSKKAQQKRYNKQQLEAAVQCNSKIREVVEDARGTKSVIFTPPQKADLTVKQMKENRKNDEHLE